MNERIIELRKALKLTQTAFGEKIGLSRDGIASYERGNAKPTGTALQCIIATWNVNREWLETGVGEMFIESPESTLDRLAVEHNLGPNQKALLSVAMEALDTLDDAACEILIDRLFAKIMEIKDEQNRKAAASVSIPSDESTDGEITNPQTAAK